TVFIPALLRREVNDRERDLLSLPARMGGMGILKPIDDCLVCHNNSVYVSEPLVRLVQRQEFEFDPTELSDEVKKLRYDVDSANDERHKEKLEQILVDAPEERYKPRPRRVPLAG